MASDELIERLETALQCKDAVRPVDLRALLDRLASTTELLNRETAACGNAVANMHAALARATAAESALAAVYARVREEDRSYRGENALTYCTVLRHAVPEAFRADAQRNTDGG